MNRGSAINRIKNKEKPSAPSTLEFYLFNYFDWSGVMVYVMVGYVGISLWCQL